MSTADIIHRKQNEINDISWTLSGISSKLLLAQELNARREQLRQEIRELEEQRHKKV